MPANTGKAGDIHRAGAFAGTPAPTGYSRYQWERVTLAS
jgi:hypothetical protein